MTNDPVSVVCLCQVPIDRTKGPTLTSGATTVTLSTAMALRFKDLMEDELHTNTRTLHFLCFKIEQNNLSTLGSGDLFPYQNDDC